MLSWVCVFMVWYFSNNWKCHLIVPQVTVVAGNLWLKRHFGAIVERWDDAIARQAVNEH